jgi:hypothetical protein
MHWCISINALSAGWQPSSDCWLPRCHSLEVIQLLLLPLLLYPCLLLRETVCAHDVMVFN